MCSTTNLKRRYCSQAEQKKKKFVVFFFATGDTVAVTCLNTAIRCLLASSFCFNGRGRQRA